MAALLKDIPVVSMNYLRMICKHGMSEIRSSLTRSVKEEGGKVEKERGREREGGRRERESERERETGEEEREKGGEEDRVS